MLVDVAVGAGTGVAVPVGVEVGGGFRINAGVANVFDRTYANHLNRSNVFDPTVVQVNEPGRTYWLRLGWRASG